MEKKAGILSSLKHPNIIEYMNHGIIDKMLYIVMEYAPGGDLSEYILKLQPHPPEKKIIALLAQLVAGVAYIHEKGIVHRDICAKNVLIGRGEVLKLSDFGMSKRLESISSGAVAGNPVNFAPELCWGGKATQASDMWALGCLLHHIARGNPPFSAPSLAGVVRTIVSAGPVRLSGYSGLLGELQRSLLAKEPSSRPSAVQLMAHPLLAIPILEAGLPRPVQLSDFEFFGISV
ncbi:serine/threonine-protein kinase Nek8 isoform X2 [Halyomorpha halys]|uniref:serine/threonine-protein kinase Nek8 isoform X2 n=1 Tax=Halyomorpha halys TaxID=286706 RepID=UPI0006D4E3B9|nr:serine/threonine-protein kinase Nek8-like isoform X2 [Halyomorpha halys]